MSQQWVVEVYKTDRRTASGSRLVEKMMVCDQPGATQATALAQAQAKYAGNRYRFVVHPAMVQKKNLMTGQPYMEPYDTPPWMSPACESYWSA